MTEVTVRDATMDDLASLARFNIDLALESENIHLDPETVSSGVRTLLEDPSKGRYFVAERDSAGGWIVLSPPGRRAKDWRWNNLLTDIDAVEVDEFVLDWKKGEDEDRSFFGLDQPRVRVLTTGDDGTQMDVRLGNETIGGAYLMLAGVPSVYKVALEVSENLEFELDDLSQPEPAADAATAEGEVEAG